MRRFALMILFCIFCGSAFSQEGALTLPSVNVKTMDGKNFNTKDIENEGKPVIICFFATWCKPCMMELKNIAEVYEEWQEETGVKIYAVSIDDSRSSQKWLRWLADNLGSMRSSWMRIPISNVP